MGTIIQFEAAALLRCVDHTLAATKWRPSWGVPTTEPTLWLVGDQGVYLMSAADPGDFLTKETEPGKARLHVAYAKGIDPTVDDFNDWWDTKRAVFGGDDFVEQFGLGFVRQVKADITAGAKTIRLKVNKRSIALMAPGA